MIEKVDGKKNKEDISEKFVCLCIKKVCLYLRVCPPMNNRGAGVALLAPP